MSWWFSLLDVWHFKSINEYKTYSKNYACVLVCMWLSLLLQNYLNDQGSSPLQKVRGRGFIIKNPITVSMDSDILVGEPHLPSLCCPIKNYFSTCPILENFSLTNDRHVSGLRWKKLFPGSLRNATRSCRKSWAVLGRKTWYLNLARCWFSQALAKNLFFLFWKQVSAGKSSTTPITYKLVIFELFLWN